MCERIVDAALDALRTNASGSYELPEEGRAALRRILAEARHDRWLDDATLALERLATLFETRAEPRAAEAFFLLAREASLRARVDSVIPTHDSFAVTRRPTAAAPKVRSRPPSRPAHRFLRGGRPGLVIVR
ncbi:MAG: hypothetical protein HYV07_05875 [Deltaproteobacteria bacterium]|nr:hypothetical protein [Deltaproteobacteria bacterium]